MWALFTFFIISGIVEVFMPSAPRCICRNIVAAVTVGRIMVGSAKVRSGNQARPPEAMDCTGALHMPRMPKNADMKKTD